jgi:hypothetical protein
MNDQPTKGALPMENKPEPEANADTNAAICAAAITALSRAVEQQTTLIERLAVPPPSPFDQLLPVVLPLLVEKLGALIDKATRPRDLGEPVGSAERQVLDEFMQARDALLRDLETKRKAARLADEIARDGASAAPSASSNGANGAAH